MNYQLFRRNSARLVALLAVLSPIAGPAHEALRMHADTARLSVIIQTLASDPFEGRAPGTVGEQRTVAYLIQHFRSLGLEPGGPGGQWTQEVSLLRTQLDMNAALTLTTPRGDLQLVQGRDLYLSTQRDIDHAKLEQTQFVFVGYGVKAPERDWDDFKGIDLKGKIAIFLVNDPDFGARPGDDANGHFGGRAMTYYGRWSYKFEEAVRQGAIGALIIHDTAAAGYGWNTIVSPQGENYDLVGANSTPRLMVQGWLSAAAAETLFDQAGLDLDRLKLSARSRDFRPVSLPKLSLSGDIPVQREHITSHNVIAKITGRSHPEETITFGSHWDAYGIGAQSGTAGRQIRSGALDDASGVAGVLELARLFKAGPRPQRSLLFTAWTAEERGLLGSEAFVTSNLYPTRKMIANITMDTLQPNGASRDFVLIGQGQNTLEKDLAVAAQAQGRSITADLAPERGLYFRADHFSFVKHGVPSLLIMALGGGVDLVKGGRAAGDHWVSDFTAHCYHQACDAWSADWDLSGAAQDVDLAYAVGRRLAFGREWPQWNKNSEFAGLR